MSDQRLTNEQKFLGGMAYRQIAARNELILIRLPESKAIGEPEASRVPDGVVFFDTDATNRVPYQSGDSWDSRPVRDAEDDVEDE